MDDLETSISEGYDRTIDFVRTAIEREREPREDWREGVSDALEELDRIVHRDAHPDDVMRARSAVHSLAHIWLDVDEAESLYLGDRIA